MKKSFQVSLTIFWALLLFVFVLITNIRFQVISNALSIESKEALLSVFIICMIPLFILGPCGFILNIISHLYNSDKVLRSGVEGTILKYLIWR